MSYGNSQGHSEQWWRLFIRKRMNLNQSLNKVSTMGIQGVICKTSKGEAVIENGKRFMVPVNTSHDTDSVSSSSSRGARHPTQAKQVKKSLCTGKGSHGLATIKKLLEDEENWEIITKVITSFLVSIHQLQCKKHFILLTACNYHKALPTHMHYLWDDVQISKSGRNKDREVDVMISGKREKLMYRNASRNGVKMCPFESCDLMAPMSAQGPCSIHTNQKLVKSNDETPCPVEFAYIYPKDASDRFRSQTMDICLCKTPKRSL